jgi:hypothetical protein
MRNGNPLSQKSVKKRFPWMELKGGVPIKNPNHRIVGLDRGCICMGKTIMA